MTDKYAMVRVKREVYDALIVAAAEMQAAQGKRVSLSNAIERLLAIREVMRRG